MDTPLATFSDISVTVSHTLKTVRVRSPGVVWVRAGHKGIITPQRADGQLMVQAGGLCLLGAGHQWDVSNHVGPSGRYAASVWGVPEAVLDAFATHYPALAGQPPLNGFATTRAPDDWAQTWERAQRAASQGPTSASAVHRGVEMLLTLAEQRLVFPSRVQLSWTDRVTNLIAQRPHADWSVDTLASHFLLSGSTLRQRLPVQMEKVRLGGRGGGRVRTFACACTLGAGAPLDAAGKGLQQMTRVLKIPLPQQACAFTGEAICRIRTQSVIHQLHALRRAQAGLGMPASLTGLTVL